MILASTTRKTRKVKTAADSEKSTKKRPTIKRQSLADLSAGPSSGPSSLLGGGESPAMAGTGPGRDWHLALRELLLVESEFIPCEQFKDKSLASEFLAPAGLVGTNDIPRTTWKQVREMPAHLARMCETALLKAEEEKLLFRRMNFAKFRAEQLRRKLNPEDPKPTLILEIESLLERAALDKDRIVRANLRLVVSIAKKFSDLRNSFDDLLSEGITSLIRAAEKFDFDRGFRFSTYATQAVRRTLCRLLQQLQRDRGRFMNAEASLFDGTAEDSPQGTMTETRWHELRRALSKMLGKLDPRERAIIRRRFGLEKSDEVQTLQSLAHEMGVCKERVRQLEMRAMNKLRSMAVEIKLAPPEEA